MVNGIGIDIDKLAAAIAAAVRGSVENGVRAGSAFIEKQSRGLAVQAAMITDARLAKKIDKDDFEFFTIQLRTLTENFARSVASLTIITLQKAWNAIVGVLWGAINQALSGAGLGALPIPRAPKV